MIAPTIQFGMETEIGIFSDAPGEVDVVAESIALVRSATEPGVWMCWDYDCEDPHVDMRGFRVHELRQDTDEADYYAQDAARQLSFVEIKSDLVLGNATISPNSAASPSACTKTIPTFAATATAATKIIFCLVRSPGKRWRRAFRRSW